MHLLLTRPKQDSELLAERLAKMGHVTLIEPLLTLRFLANQPINFTDVQAILLTSANAVRALQPQKINIQLPVFAVGKMTAEAAKSLGFVNVTNASGNVNDLVRSIRNKLRPELGQIVHIAAASVAGDLIGQLKTAGYKVRKITIYETIPTRNFRTKTRDALSTNSLDGVLLYSPRSARTFVDILRRENLSLISKKLNLYALSEAIADAASNLVWQKCFVASEPNENALLQLLSNTNSGGYRDQ